MMEVARQPKRRPRRNASGFPRLSVIAVAPEENHRFRNARWRRAWLSSAASMVTRQHACQLWPDGGSRCVRDRELDAFFTVLGPSLTSFLKYRALWRPMARYTAGSGFALPALFDSLGCGCHRFVMGRLEGRARNGIESKARRSRFRSW